MRKLVCIGGGNVPRYMNGVLLPHETKEIDAGETPIEGLEREIREELGIIIDRNKAKFFKTVIDDDRHIIKDIYLYKENIDIKSLNFSDKEVSDAKYVSIDEYMQMFHNGDIVYNVDFNLEDYKKAILL